MARQECLCVVSHVCQAWRDLILGNPLLWQTFSNINHSPEWTREQLRRSGSVPLDIDIPICYLGLVSHEPSWEPILSQLTRIRSMKISWSPELVSHDLS